MNERTNYEKIVEGAYQLANAVSAHHEALIEKGFTKTQALSLARSYQEQLLNLFKPDKRWSNES